MTLTTGRQELAGHSGEPSDDYIIETETERPRPPASLQIIRFLQAILIIAIAVLSFAVFWMVGLIIGVF
jgi:hypothetical protein